MFFAIISKYPHFPILLSHSGGLGLSPGPEASSDQGDSRTRGGGSDCVGIMAGYQEIAHGCFEDTREQLSKLLVSPIITSFVVPYMTPLKGFRLQLTSFVDQLHNESPAFPVSEHLLRFVALQTGKVSCMLTLCSSKSSEPNAQRRLTLVRGKTYADVSRLQETARRRQIGAVATASVARLLENSKYDSFPK